MPSVLEHLNSALHRAFTDDPSVYILGEDILDPYGGAFKVTRGLSTLFPDRVITTPISEAAIIGISTGMALRGLHPVVEIMFGDFITLAADQIVNHLSKFRWMYNNQVSVPMVIRTPMGGRRGYGPTHSQTLEKLFFGIPGIHIVAPTNLGDPGNLLYLSICSDQDPVLFIENKLLYSLPVYDSLSLTDYSLDTRFIPLPEGELTFPVYHLTIKGAPPPTLTIAAYGYMAELGRQAVSQLAYQHEIFSELIVPSLLAPFDVKIIMESTLRTKNLLVLEEGTLTTGWGAEIIARIAESLPSISVNFRRVAAKDAPIPASNYWENIFLPSLDQIVHVARKMR